VTDSVKGKESISGSQSVKEFAASTLTGHTQMMMSRSSELSQMVKTEALEVGKRTSLIISSSIAVLMIFVLLNYLLINRSVLRSISALEKGTGRIGSGDLDTTIETGTNDEMGDLSVAITAMAANLKTVLTSKSNLEKEVAERKKAEEALHSVNEELTAIEEELRTNLDELTRQELILRESEGVLKSILDTTPAGVGLIVNRVLQKVNHSLCKITGYSEEEIIGQSTRMLYPDEDEYLRVGRELYEQMERQGFGTVEARLRRKDGAIIIVMLSMSPFDPQDITAGVTATALDITERKRAEEALRESEERYHNVVEDQNEYICRFLPDGTHIFVNDAYCRYFDKKREEIIGRRFRPILHPEDRENIVQHIASITTEHPVRDIDQRIIMPDGSTRWQRWSDRGIFDPDGRVVEYQSVGRDITDRKLAEEALALASRKLTLLSGITRHDINNQLTILMGYLTILQKKQPDPAFDEYFGKVSTAAQRISSMIQFTREYECIGVKAPAWQNCRTLVDTAAKEAQLGKVMVKNDLPAGAEVFADPLIVKVCYNLMDNAVRYGEKIKTLRFSVEEAGDGVHLIVCEDDGNGVVAEEKEKIFERGFGKNTGLGLALAREILDITGITIRETGEPGKGARFEMMVPKGAWRSVRRDA
jgi:PAS domain S-box-containing protein